MKTAIKLIIALIIAISFAIPSFAGTVDVTLVWDASAGATGYNLYWGTVSGGPYTKLNVNNVLTYKLTKLTCNPCYFTATAYDAQGAESDYATEISYARLTAPKNFKTMVITVTLP
jgi:hypothetical protein